jgi:hypothetical protein
MFWAGYCDEASSLELKSIVRTSSAWARIGALGVFVCRRGNLPVGDTGCSTFSSGRIRVFDLWVVIL